MRLGWGRPGKREGGWHQKWHEPVAKMVPSASLLLTASNGNLLPPCKGLNRVEEQSRSVAPATVLLCTVQNTDHTCSKLPSGARN